MESTVQYDAEADSLYVTLANAKVAHTSPRDDLRVVDYAENGSVVGVEFVGVAGGIDLTDLPQAEKIDRLISESGLSIKILA